jgi:hypothetical protein
MVYVLKEEFEEGFKQNIRFSEAATKKRTKTPTTFCHGI